VNADELAKDRAVIENGDPMAKGWALTAWVRWPAALDDIERLEAENAELRETVIGLDRKLFVESEMWGAQLNRAEAEVVKLRAQQAAAVDAIDYRYALETMVEDSEAEVVKLRGDLDEALALLDAVNGQVHFPEIDAFLSRIGESQQ
jgi:hypothetical protein